MYQQFFNFKAPPFSIAPDPQYIYMSEDHEEGLAHLFYGVKHGGFVALTGEVGTGKTMLCHCFLEDLPDNIDMALILNPKLNTVELLATICDELQINYDHENQTIKGLIDILNKYLLEVHALGWQTVLMIDEAQNLSLDVLEQIRLLTNLETSKTKLLQIILVGQPELKQLLERPELRQLNQRITARYHLSPLTYQDTKQYIKHRLEISGGSTKTFNRGAIREIFKLTNGIPRLINILADRALLGAYVSNSHTVTSKIVNKASKEVLNFSESSRSNFLTYILSGVFLVTVLLLAIYYFVPIKSPNKHIVLSGSFKKPLSGSVKKPLSGSVKKPLLDSVKKPLSDSVKTPLSDSVKKPVEIETKLQTPVQLDFITTIKQQGVPLNTAISKLAKLWNKDTSINSGCKEIEEAGLRCLLDKTSWKNLIALNRPVIMEFSVSKSKKIYALLVGIKKNQLIFQFEKHIFFPAEQVIAAWNGHYLILWQSPIENVEQVFLGQSSSAVLWIKKQLTQNHHQISNVNSAYFDKELHAEIIKFQRKHQLATDGIVGPRTFMHLNNVDPQNKSPRLKLNF